jgi:hypothetical protein
MFYIMCCETCGTKKKMHKVLKKCKSCRYGKRRKSGIGFSCTIECVYCDGKGHTIITKYICNNCSPKKEKYIDKEII